ncbi:hypothetical protein AOQ84DRAFT_402964 [Glonium stellatum]|uniref:Uncharacterized protein n=1 Tax=Glonium stellatum TaxID=574774 RepID=A0A8E2ENF2_9PEZI|nr:hypothetical protein AOQ84DRAFT_402964 [Glonium stellatum]
MPQQPLALATEQKQACLASTTVRPAPPPATHATPRSLQEALSSLLASYTSLQTVSTALAPFATSVTFRADCNTTSVAARALLLRRQQPTRQCPGHLLQSRAPPRLSPPPTATRCRCRVAAATQAARCSSRRRWSSTQPSCMRRWRTRACRSCPHCCCCCCASVRSRLWRLSGLAACWVGEFAGKVGFVSYGCGERESAGYGGVGDGD